jgi:hypothetical protein
LNVTVIAPAEKRTTLAGYGIEDAYTATEVDALLAAKATIGAGGQGNGVPLIVGGITYTSAGVFREVVSGSPGAATDIYIPVDDGTVVDSLFILEVAGYDKSGSGDEFLDVVYYSAILPAAISALSSTTVKGTPKTRTYTESTGTIKLSLATGAATYRVVVGARRLKLA